MKMSEQSIQTTNISKQYFIGFKGTKPNTLAGEILNFFYSPIRNFKKLKKLSSNEITDNETSNIWALRDINLNINKNEVVGIIGKNGSGKSTLLKILSKITYPSTGSALINGKVGSLLEVGTGFHDELTGMENIYLNGTILGMKKHEIDNKLDDIINFSGISEFIHTPIKRYSSGMRVRLAFSVAAHIETDILIIDEVLAVGDSSFQEKCLGKMHELAQSGKTVLFVSHNMQSISSLCTRVIWIDEGKVIADGNPEEIIKKYFKTIKQSSSSDINLNQVRHRGGDGIIKFSNIKLRDKNNNLSTKFAVGEEFNAIIKIKNVKNLLSDSDLLVKIIITNQNNNKVLVLNNLSDGHKIKLQKDSKYYDIQCNLDKIPIGVGMYKISLEAWVNNGKADTITDLMNFEIIPGDFSGFGFPESHTANFHTISKWS